jgi:hypothetical protein
MHTQTTTGKDAQSPLDSEATPSAKVVACNKTQQRVAKGFHISTQAKLTPS